MQTYVLRHGHKLVTPWDAAARNEGNYNSENGKEPKGAKGTNSSGPVT